MFEFNIQFITVTEDTSNTLLINITGSKVDSTYTKKDDLSIRQSHLL